jgi:hypothetical protein
VAHYSRLYKVVIDVPAAVHDREVAFWGAATGHPLAGNERYPEYHGTILEGQHFGLLTQLLEEGGSRVHLDIHTDDLEAEVARLERIGATKVRQMHRWWIMQDPAGLPFCVIPDPPGTLNDENAQRWE